MESREHATFDCPCEKYGLANNARLSKLSKKPFKHKQMDSKAASDYTNDMCALMVEIECNTSNDTKKI